MFRGSKCHTVVNNKGSLFLPVKMEVVPLGSASYEETGDCPAVAVDRCSRKR